MLRIGKYIQIFIVGWLVSFYIFPTFFTLLPSVNTKMILAVLGGAILAIQTIFWKDHTIDRGLLRCLLIAIFYSAVNALSVDFNGQTDYSYATYITSALVWLFGAYAVTQAIKATHGKVTILILTSYLAAVCALQCLLAIYIDNNEGVAGIVDSIFYISDFIKDIDRLYGIGAALDTSGVRFAVTLTMIGFALASEERIQINTWGIIGLMTSFAVITVIGAIMSRTTIVGLPFAGLAFLHSTGLLQLHVKTRSARLVNVFFSIVAIALPLMVLLYNTDEYFHGQIRYGFEGFFSLVEGGKWETSSTNELNTMWIWPDTTREWIIGRGSFGSYLTDYVSDIGYCRFIRYSGLVGFSIFSFFFLYSAGLFSTRYPRYRYMFWSFGAITFIIWIKVATDIFCFYALLYTFVDRGNLNPKLEASNL